MYKQIELNEQILDNFIDLLEKNESDILYNYNGKNNQILIKNTLVSHILSFIKKNLSSKKYSYADLTKSYIRAAFELETNSVIINKNGHIFLKIIDESVKKQILPEEKNTVKNRYNGIQEEELNSFYNEFFKEEENHNFFLYVAQDFVQKYLLTKQISNEEYEEKVFAYIHTITLKKLTEIYDDEDGFFLGFAGYIFRIHFKEVFIYIAELILDEIALSNPYMMQFLDYYAQGVLVINGKKYKVPHIKAENGLRWTVPSMLSIVKIYTKAKQNIIEFKKDKMKLQNKVKKYYINGLSPIKSNELLQEKKISLEIQIEEKTKNINRLQNRLNTIQQNDRKKTIQLDIKKEQEDLESLRKEKEIVIKNIVKKSGLSQYMLLQKELDSITRKLQREKKLLKQNEEAYNSIKTSLIKALIAKKSKI